MRKFILPVFFLLCVFLLSADSPVENERIYPVYLMVKKPVLDGMVAKDPAWNNIPAATGFFVLQSSMYYVEDNPYIPAIKQTFFKMGYTPEAFYLGIWCEEPDVNLIKSTARDNDVLIWEDDSVEILLFPKEGTQYYHFMVNAAGAKWNSAIQEMPAVTLGDWHAKASLGRNFWSVEIKIPFRALGRVPVDGEIWSGNICRNLIPGSLLEDGYGWGDRFSSWAGLIQNFHEPDRFAGIVFHDRGLSSSEVKKTEEKLRLQTSDIVNREMNKRIALVRDEIYRILTTISKQKEYLRECPRNNEEEQEMDSIITAAGWIEREINVARQNTLTELVFLKKKKQESMALLYQVDELKRLMLIKKLLGRCEK